MRGIVSFLRLSKLNVNNVFLYSRDSKNTHYVFVMRELNVSVSCERRKDKS